MENLCDFLSVLPTFSQLLPATAFVAILIFAFKEYLEARRRNAADIRKVLALKKVLARDCQLNYTAIDRLIIVMTDIRDGGIYEDATRISFSTSPSGGHVYMLSGTGSDHGGSLISIQRDALLKHLIEIAGLDEDFYSKCEKALDGLSEANHVYNSLVYGPPSHFPSSQENYYEGLVDYGLEELRKSVDALKELYLACTGKGLERGKLR
jgi:hypothetical protein